MDAEHSPFFGLSICSGCAKVATDGSVRSRCGPERSALLRDPVPGPGLRPCTPTSGSAPPATQPNPLGSAQTNE